MSRGSVDPLSAAFELHRAGRLAEAESLYRQLLAQTPRRPEAWHLLGTLCLQAGRAAEAVPLIRRAIELAPAQAEFYNHLGAALGALGDGDAAVNTLRHAVRLAPRSSSAHFNLGTALRNAGRLEEAVASFRHAVAADLTAAEAHYNLANTLRELERPAEAEAAFRAALAARPDYVKAMLNLANLLHQQQRPNEALPLARQAVATEPTYANAELTLGTLLRDAGQFDAAVDHLRQAVALAPAMAEAHNNLGTALQALAQYDEAWNCYEQALTLDPNLADAHFSHAAHRLRLGDLAGGMAEYEWRWKCKSYSTRRFHQPRWSGEPLAGKTVLLHAEQGLGDTLQFVRFASLVRQHGGGTIVECQPPLVPILRSCPGVDRLLPAGSEPPPFDLHCPLMSLPGVLGLREDQLWQGTYLSADPVLVNAWGQKMSPRNSFSVGICWQGNPRHAFDRQRSCALSHFAPLAAMSGVKLVSLQKGPAAEQIARVPFAVVELGAELDTAAGSFMDTAAVMANLDLVISADTATCHLAGALGVPLWVALSAHSDWRWMLGRDTSPWYPTARLFRQARLDHWEDVFARMAAELDAWVLRRATRLG
jgi:tetratricopeptide (TPR) repeat protein